MNGLKGKDSPPSCAGTIRPLFEMLILCKMVCVEIIFLRASFLLEKTSLLICQLNILWDIQLAN